MMMKGQKLRKFRLTAREGFISAGWYNEELLEEHFVADTVKGYLDEDGDLMVVEVLAVIRREDLKFFEEVLT